MRNVEQDRQALRIFSEACALPPGERQAAIARACAGDAALLDRVRRMLAADADSSGGIAAEAKVGRFIADQVRRIDPDLHDDGPEVEGHYTILRIIGEGGMGTVYEAQQHKPRRRVAIKAIRPGRITPQMRRRFDYEAQVLGRLEHVGIARLYEADTQNDDGRVRAFLAMELVIGEPIDVYAKHHELDVPGRLRLFTKVCDAIAYAHRMGVIHRDLKPANILVNREGQPKVLDFGVARTVGDEKLITTMLTEHGQIVGTLAYMSPEQVEGRPDIDTRSDVYALGVVLFKLLTGTLPIDLDQVGLAAATTRLLHQTPRRLGDVDRRLRGDLDVIVGRALEKDRARRYDSVEQLCAEIGRFLSGRPIEARRDSTFYVFRKIVWRHRAIVGVASLLLAMLIAFGGYASVTADRNRDLAVAAIASEARATRHAEQVRRSLYFSSIGFAQSALQNNDMERVHTLLDACDPELRGWEWAYLKRQCDVSSSSEELKLDQPRYAAIADDGSVAAFASLAREVLLIEPQTGRERFRATIPEGTARIALSRDGRHLAYGGTADLITLVDVHSGEQRSLKVDAPAGRDGSPRLLRALAFDDAGDTLVSAGLDGALHVWDVPTATLLRSIDRGPALPICMTILRGSIALVGDNRGGLRAFDVKTGMLVRTYEGHDAPVWSLAVSRDGKWIASGDNDARLIIWEAETGRVVTQFDTNDGWITSLAFNADHSMLAVARSDSTIRLVHLPDASSSGVLRGHRHAVVHVEFDDGDTLRSVSLDGTARTWRTDAAMGVPTVDAGQQQTVSAAFTRDGKQLLVGGGDGSVRSWHVERALAGMPPGEASPLPSHRSTVLEIAIDPTNTGRACTAGSDGAVLLVDIASGALVRTIAQLPGPVAALAFSPDRRRILVGSAQGLLLYDADTGSLIRTYPLQGCVANEAIFDGTGTAFYAGCSDGKVRRWSLDGNDAVAEAMLDRAGIYDLALSPDGRSLVVTGDTGIVALVDAKTLATLRTFTGHQGPVTGAAFDPSGSRLATCGNDRSIRIWDVESGTELLSLRGHRRIVQHVAFTPDGATLASTSDDGTIRFWRGSSKKSLRAAD